MSVTAKGVLRSQGWLKDLLLGWAFALAPLVFRLLRAIDRLRFGKIFVVTRYDDVREVFLNDQAFRVPYHEKLEVLMDKQPFFLGMDDTPPISP